MKRERWRQHLVAAVGCLLTVAVLGPLIWIVSLRSDDSPDDIYTQSDNHLRRLVRSLNSLEQERQQNATKDANFDEHTVSSKVPWLLKDSSKFLPNVYLRKSTNNVISSSAVVYLNQQLSITSDRLHGCLSNISYDNNLPMSPVMHVQNRLLWEAGTKDSNLFKDRIKIHRGPYAFGVCEKLSIKCAHFLMVHEPFDLALSSYDYCKSNPFNEMCRVFRSKSVSLREWILQQRGALFHQILFSPELCSQEKLRKFKYMLASQSSIVTNPDHENPCWYRQKLLLGKALSDQDVGHITDYIVSHLSDWFAVIGITDDVEHSLLMFEKALQLPFTKCQSVHQKHHEISSSHVNNNRVNPSKVKDDDYEKGSNEYNADRFNKKEELEGLRDDYRIQEAMLPDMKIYKEAKRLFHIQKQMFLNKV